MFQEWPAQDLLGPPVNVTQGTVIQKAGAEVRTLDLIEQGIVGRFVSVQGHEVLDRVRTTGWLLGAEPAISTGRYGAKFAALSNCVLRTMSIDRFRRALARPEVNAWLNQMLAADEAAQSARRAGLFAGTTQARVQEVLIELMQAAGHRAADGSIRLALPLKVTELADFVGATREHTSRVLAELEAKHWLTREKGWFVAPPTSPLTARIR